MFDQGADQSKIQTNFKTMDNEAPLVQVGYNLYIRNLGHQTIVDKTDNDDNTSLPTQKSKAKSSGTNEGIIVSGYTYHPMRGYELHEVCY